MLMVTGGIILLLPGVCALYFINMFSGSFGGPDAVFFIGLWAICFAISAWGIGLLVTALR
jgi:hypothetical protein